MRFLNNIFYNLRFNRRNWKAVMLCVFTATVFWLFNALNKTYRTNISFPLAFEYDKENFIPVEGLPKSVRLNVTGSGWELFKRSAGVKADPLAIALDGLEEVKKIVGSQLRSSFTYQLNGLEINHVLSDTIHVDLEPKIGRWVKVDVDSVQYNIKQGYNLTSDVAVRPDSTYVVGPRRIVEKIREPVMLNIPQRNIDKHYVETISVELPFKEIVSIEPRGVSVMFNVEKMVRVQDSVALTIENIPATVSEVMNSRKLPVTLSIPESFMQNLRMDSVKAVLDLRNFTGGTAKILPRVEGLPPYSDVIKIDSVIVRL